MPDHVHQHDDYDLQEWSVSDISVSDQSPQLLVLLVLVSRHRNFFIEHNYTFGDLH